MTFLILMPVALLSWRAGLSLWRLWSALPDRNVDLGLTDDDFDLEKRT